MTNLPNIVFVHEGNQDYVQAALETARRHGNVAVQRGLGDPSAAQQLFESRYRKMSHYDRRFDLICFERYFAIQKLMRDLQLDSIFHLDSDVLLFDDLKKFEAEWLRPQNAFCGLHMPQNQQTMRYSFGAHSSYWTRAAIDQFCEFLLQVYQDMPAQAEEKWAWHQKTGAPGGVCDMTMLYFWARGRSDILNFTQPIGDAVFDYNLNTAENYVPGEYRTRFGKKAVTFRDGNPFGIAADGRPVRFRSLHFQGSIKNQMRRFSAGKSYAVLPLLVQQARTTLKSYSRSIAAKAMVMPA